MFFMAEVLSILYTLVPPTPKIVYGIYSGNSKNIHCIKKWMDDECKRKQMNMLNGLCPSAPYSSKI